MNLTIVDNRTTVPIGTLHRGNEFQLDSSNPGTLYIVTGMHTGRVYAVSIRSGSTCGFAPERPVHHLRIVEVVCERV